MKHRSLYDNINEGKSRTWCGLTLDIMDESLDSMETTCKKCLKARNIYKESRKKK